MRYFSTFSGIGGFELGIEKAYGRYNNSSATAGEPQAEGELSTTRESSLCEDCAVSCNCSKSSPMVSCVGFSEIDKHATTIYQKHFPTHHNYGDITKINAEELPDFDLLVGGFPCQSFSIAGKRRGFEDTRGTMFFELARILRAKQPRLFVFENVKGLLSHDNGQTFRTIIATLDELGYDCQWQVLNSKNHGVPQNRERIFIIGHLRGTPQPQVFPFGQDGGETDESCERQGGGGEIAQTITATYWKGAKGSHVQQLNKPTHSNDRVYGADGISPTLNTMQGGNRQPFVAMQWRRSEKGRRVRSENMKNGRDYTPFSDEHRELVPHPTKPIGALTAQAIAKDSLLGTLDNLKIRRLTPTECERLQGFPDGWTDGISDTQRYKTLGNAVTVNVIHTIMSKLLA